MTNVWDKNAFRVLFKRKDSSQGEGLRVVARGATEGGGIPPSAVALRGFRGRLLIGRQPVDHQ